MSAEPDPEFVDTNVLVYAHDRSAGAKHDRAVALMERLWQEHIGCLSLQVLAEFYVTVTRKVPQPLTPAGAAQIVADLTAWRVHAPVVADLLDALALQQRYTISLWDAQVIGSAARLGCAILWSEDLNTGQSYAGVRVANPFVA
jgi:predicted nucleic acid-binding protein